MGVVVYLQNCFPEGNEKGLSLSLSFGMIQLSLPDKWEQREETATLPLQTHPRILYKDFKV